MSCSNAHFYDGSFGLEHLLSEQLSNSLLPGQRGLLSLLSLLPALPLLGLHLSIKKKKSEMETF